MKHPSISVSQVCRDISAPIYSYVTLCCMKHHCSNIAQVFCKNNHTIFVQIFFMDVIIDFDQSWYEESLHYCLSSLQFKPDPEAIKLFSCSTQLSMKFFLLINVTVPTVDGILTFLSRKNSFLGLSEQEKC